MIKAMHNIRMVYCKYSYSVVRSALQRHLKWIGTAVVPCSSFGETAYLLVREDHIIARHLWVREI